MWEGQLPVKTEAKKLLTASIFSMTVVTRSPALFITRVVQSQQSKSPWSSARWCYRKIQHRAVSFSGTHILMQRRMQCKFGGNAVIAFEIRIYRNLFSNFPKSWSKCLHCSLHGGRRIPCVMVRERYPYSSFYSASSVQNPMLICGSQKRCSWENVKHWVANPMFMAATLDSKVWSSQISPPQPYRGLQTSTKRFKAAHLAQLAE